MAQEYSEEFLNIAEEQIIFYRTHLDIAIEDMFYPVKLTRDQHIIARAIGNCEDIKVVCSRGFGKTFLGGLCAAALAALYTGADQVVTSNTAQQATLMIEKIKIIAEQNQNLANEIRPINSKALVSIAKDAASCVFKNGTKIFSTALDSARGKRAKVLWQDESLQVDQESYDAIAEPIKNTTRYCAATYGFKDFPSKTICLTSACEKGNPFFDRYMKSVKAISRGDKGYFACAFDYKAAISNGITDSEFFEKEKLRMPESTFDMEYGTIFLGSSSNSAFPYELIDTCRTLQNVELEQHRNSKSRYVIGLDIATSEAKDADNSIIVVIKFTERSDGSFAKKLVYMQSFHGKTLDILAEEIRRLYHTKFPNTEKIIYDARGLGDSLDRFFDKEYVDTLSGKEFPPLVVDDAPLTNPIAVPILHPFRAVQGLNQRIYTNLRVSLEKRTIELPIPYRVMQMNEINVEESKRKSSYEKVIFLEADALQHEMSNIIAKIGASGNVLYDTPRNSMHKDRYSSTAMANDYICELEKDNIKKHQRGDSCIGVVSIF